MDNTSTNRARAAYHAYGQTTDFKNFRGDPMPEWDALPEKIREAWVNASRAAAAHHEPVTTYTTDQIDSPGETDAETAVEATREGVNRLRAAAARLESGEACSFALAFVPETEAPFYSFAIRGGGMRLFHGACATLHMGVTTVAADIAAMGGESRLRWRHEEARRQGRDPAPTPRCGVRGWRAWIIHS